MEMRSNTRAEIKCKRCRAVFSPDFNVRGAWACPRCAKKNPNLRRHYRSVADLCILGIIATAVARLIMFRGNGITLGFILSVTHASLLLATIILVYRSQTPWTEAATKALIWTVFGFALFFNVVLPMVLLGKLNVAFLILCSLIFPYLFWLHTQSKRCMVAGRNGPSSLQRHEQT